MQNEPETSVEVLLTAPPSIPANPGALGREQAAKQLDGSEYGHEGSRELFAAMKTARLVAIFGASDDLMELRGAVYEEIGCWGGGGAFFTPAGLLQNECANDRCPHFLRMKDGATRVKAIWGEEEGEVPWRYETTIPHSTFTVNEDGDPYCIGIVFSLDDVPSLPSSIGG